MVLSHDQIKIDGSLDLFLIYHINHSKVWITYPIPLHISHAFAVGADRLADVGNAVIEQGVEREPSQIVALVRLRVRELPRPRGRFKEEIELFAVVLL
jgi:hypothetical protein